MTGHIYSIGQQVSLDGSGRTYLKLADVFTVTRLLPPVGVELQYRIKSETEAHERVNRNSGPWRWQNRLLQLPHDCRR